MDARIIKTALADITAEKDPTLKSQKLASICSALFRERGIELIVVGGSAIEFYTEGAYASGDLDLCYSADSKPLTLRLRQELMGELRGEGGPRSWQVAGMFVDILGQIESLAKTPFRKLDAPYGQIKISQPEDLLVERILVSVYPGENENARNCAEAFLVTALRGEIELDWNELKRLAERPEYRIFPQCETLVKEVPINSKSKIPCIPLNESISWEDWLRGRKARRESSKLMTPEIIRRKKSSSDGRLKKLFDGERGLPFTPTSEL